MQELLKIWLIPPAINIVILFVGLILLRKFQKTGVILIFLSTLTLYLLSTPNIASRLVRSLEVHEAVQIDELPPDENIVIVVPGASHYIHTDEYGRASPTPPGLVRLHYAAHLHRRTGFPILLTGGPIPQTREPHAEVMQRALKQEYQIDKVRLETNSTSTFENALYSANILLPEGINKILLVTHSYHMKRSVMLFENAGFEVLPAPTKLSDEYSLTQARYWRPRASELEQSARAIYEYIGILWYKYQLSLDHK